jgi:hypothetical protein
MKQAILSFSKCKVLLAVLPEGATHPQQTHIYHGEDPIVFHVGEQTGSFYFDGFVDTLGKLSDLTEEQCAEIVDSWQRYFPTTHTVYCNYNYPVEYDAIKGKEQQWSHPFGKARESFLSKMEAEGYYTKAPEVKEEPSDFGPGWNMGYGGFPQRIVEEMDRLSARTFPPDQTYVFIIIKE